MEILLEAGADPNMPNNAGMTPTLTACSIAHEITLITLLKNVGINFIIINNFIKALSDKKKTEISFNAFTCCL